MFKKKKKIEIFNILKMQISEFSWKKKKKTKIWHGCNHIPILANQPELSKSCPTPNHLHCSCRRLKPKVTWQMPLSLALPVPTGV